MNNRINELTLLTIVSLRFNLRRRLIELDSTTADEFEEILNFFGGVTNKQQRLAEIPEPVFYSLEAPDICANCFTELGSTVGGRIRNGCPYCRTRTNKLADDLVILKIDSGLDSNEAEFYISKILAEFF